MWFNRRHLKNVFVAASLVLSMSTASAAFADKPFVSWQWGDPAPAGVEDEQWSPTIPRGGGWQGVSFEEVNGTSLFPSGIFGTHKYADGEMRGGLCTSTADVKCALDTQMMYRAILDVCKTSDDEGCVVSLRAITADGRVVQGVFERLSTDTPTGQFEAERALAIPAGKSPGVWRLPDLLHSGEGDRYTVRVVAEGVSPTRNADGTWPPFILQNFQARIAATSLVTGRYNFSTYHFAPEAADANNPTGRLQDGLHGPDNSEGSSYCEVVGGNQCEVRRTFPRDVRFEVSFRLPDTPGGWLHGRVRDPQVSIEPRGAKGVLVTLSGAPVEVPVVSAFVKASEAPENIRARYIESGKWGCCSAGDDSLKNDPLKRVTWDVPRLGGNQAISDLLLWLPVVKDTASAVPAYWNVRSLDGNQLAGANSCMTNQKQVNGIVTTNATTYSAGPPVLNPATASLDYKVAAPHSRPNGQLFTGTYNLAVRSDVARCIYGFSKAPIQASVSVISADGKNEVATTAVSEKDGWLYLAAYNFTFSSPTVQAVFTQKIDQTVTPAVPITEVKKSIICFKGKMVKKVTAVKPACPGGYKPKR